ncbi:hypothetical protein PJW08_00220 (plasmid) [Tenacibaculum finnmarkense]|nr:hypothetical protein PJW08_00220 [Tenacibaculum finnmarkense]
MLNYTEDKLDEILDIRDENLFSSKWMLIYDELKSISDKNNVDKSYSDEMRELAFKKVFNQTNNSDLSSYISDDIGMVIDALTINYQNPWLNSLWLEYKNGNIPFEVNNSNNDKELASLI